MKVAIIGSRTLQLKDLEQYLPQEVTEIVSGGACGIDTCAKNYAIEHHIQLTEFLPNYEKYGSTLVVNKRTFHADLHTLAVTQNGKENRHANRPQRSEPHPQHERRTTGGAHHPNCRADGH